MSSLPWVRVGRRLLGLSPAQQLPYLETLLEAEEGQSASDYGTMSWVLPLNFAAVGLAVFVTLAVKKTPHYLIGTAAFLVAAVVVWAICRHIDRSIPAGRKRIRKVADSIWSRYKGFKNQVGLEPAIAERVGEVLNSAAGIYLKHSKPLKYFGPREPETPYTRCRLALEEAMARMLDLAVPSSPAAQELELAKGWALPLLAEMRSLDAAMSRLEQLPGPNAADLDPLFHLRDARLELESFEAARNELDLGS